MFYTWQFDDNFSYVQIFMAGSNHKNEPNENITRKFWPQRYPLKQITVFKQPVLAVEGIRVHLYLPLNALAGVCFMCVPVSTPAC